MACDQRPDGLLTDSGDALVQALGSRALIARFLHGQGKRRSSSGAAEARKVLHRLAVRVFAPPLIIELLGDILEPTTRQHRAIKPGAGHSNLGDARNERGTRRRIKFGKSPREIGELDAETARH